MYHFVDFREALHPDLHLCQQPPTALSDHIMKAEFKFIGMESGDLLQVSADGLHGSLLFSIHIKGRDRETPVKRYIGIQCGHV
jgi:hypothetical protein